MGNREREGFAVHHPDGELEAFKREIDLRQLAVSLGYEMDRRKSWRGSAVLRRGSDKVVVKRNGNGHYVFFSLRDDHDHGTVIDFLQRRQRLSLGSVRTMLRPWVGGLASTVQLPRLEPSSRDRTRVAGEYRRMTSPRRFSYLELERKLPAAVLESARFAGRIRIDSRGNTVFPHFDAGGLCGYEIKNRGFTGFAAGGRKGLWCSHCRPDDGWLVLAESAIDALSYAALFPDAQDRTRYASLGGRPSSRQLALVQAAVVKVPEIALAFDADEAGRKLVETVRLTVANSGKKHAQIHINLPATEGEDWNQVLQKSGRWGSSEVTGRPAENAEAVTSDLPEDRLSR